MSDIWTLLVELLSEHSIKEVEADGGRLVACKLGVLNYDEVLRLPNYEALFNAVKELKQTVEDIEMKPAESQVGHSLMVLIEESEKQGYKLPNVRVQAIQSFIRGGIYKSRWTAPQRLAFDQRSQVITGWIDFFVSYTNRNAAEINMQFEKLIKSVFAYFPRLPERRNVNYVAKIISKYLEQQNLRGFTDYNVLKCGDDIREAVLEHCQRAFGLVQLIEHETFKEPPLPARNWCYEEYQEFARPRVGLSAVQTVGKIYFHICGSNIERLKPAYLGQYQNWYQHIAALKYISLEGIDKKKLRAEIQTIALDILECKRAVIRGLALA